MKQFAKVLLRAANAHVLSYDHNASANVASGQPVDYGQFYRVSISSAVTQEAAKEEGMDPHAVWVIQTMLTDHWNDSISWAESVLE